MNFYASAWTGKAQFMGVAAASVTIDSVTQATATWTDGVPTTSKEAAPELTFTEVASGIIIYSIST